MKLLLTSSGITNDAIAEALSSLAGRSLLDLNLVFVLTAANTEGGDKGWLIDNLVAFQKRNFKSIDIIDIAGVSSANWKKRFHDADVICFGGGNEKYLAELFSEVGMREFLIPILKDKVYVGISAGSMVAGQFIPNELYSSVFPEEDFGNITKDAMGIYKFCFIPHLNSSFFSRIRIEILEGLKDKFTTSVYSTDDETAIKISGEKIEIVGSGKFWIYNK